MSCPQIPEPHPDNKTTSSKIQDVPRGPAGKALIALLLKRDAEGSPLLYFTKWTGSPVAFASQLERIEEVIVSEHLLKGDTLLELLEGKDFGFLHG